MAFDAKSAAAEIVRLVGGKENINSVAHCMTRLRFVVKDLKKADQEALKKVPGVLGVIYAGGQLMVVLGKNLLPVYETVVKDFDLLEGAAVNENLDAPAEKKPLTLKSAGVAVLEYVSAAVAPMITGLVAGGMLKVVLLLITLVNAGFADTATYALLSGLADAPFFFTNPIEQIIWMDKDKFEKHLKEEEAIRTEEQKATLSYLETELEISPIDNPYDYVKELQSRFDNSGIEYSDEYYDVLGIDRK